MTSGRCAPASELKDGRLYDLGNDVHEDRDLSGAYPEKKAELQGLLDAFRTDLEAHKRPLGRVPGPEIWYPATIRAGNPSPLSTLVNALLLLISPALAALLLKRRRTHRPS